MDIYSHKNLWKLLLFLFAALIGAGTLLYTETFLKQLRAEEMRNLRNWAEAMRIVQTAPPGQDLTFTTIYLQQNRTIPLILVDQEGEILYTRNLDEKRSEDPKWVQKKLQEMKADHEPIPVPIDENITHFLYYSDSVILKQLRIYPVILLGVIALFVFIAYLAFSSARRSEQNRVWTGMARETAHQIGTPLSSLMGWIELLRARGTDESTVGEMEKDIHRLETITDRFSKIGSQPKIENCNLGEALEGSLEYLASRVSRKIEIKFDPTEAYKHQIPMNPQLFGWVIENLVRNAIDAIEGRGKITIQVEDLPRTVQIDVSDTGKGIPLNQSNAIFRPGFTTKSRGWGLGLSLAKRIIENYHNGKIFVAHSEIGKGTTFRILLPKS
ncbi:MAG: HAMP domain-containing histidine kinase [Bacteroidota bacterium]|nr:HAMP domain-containing histidine kinase [Bacteroidota bacterium]MDX5405366.1 HAMP domain-containing histidine kinase [Bacteroidota bacterium]MDX5427627.1 HAMP domain-containing histidine kinase [Bacteroidota bacterium]MDX5446756.1 HAMP domain-containing histidine kinase [Bacteroidota bacterium]MDX5505535.1 HAMP domain-containing histidine kinase [Bacteroidota bacterium]